VCGGVGGGGRGMLELCAVSCSMLSGGRVAVGWDGLCRSMRLQ